MIFAENRAGASLGPGLFAFFAKRPGHIAGGKISPFAVCLPFFAKTAKKGKPRLAPARFFRKKQNRGKTASGVGARKNQNQDQNQNQNQNQSPGGNPPDPFFLSIFFLINQ
ncbi:MAG: hypothetical protein HQL83_00060 [Magnetococcales bacterium]|nr:hypothetical protein [Magnetococcales bacterium]